MSETAAPYDTNADQIAPPPAGRRCRAQTIIEVNGDCLEYICDLADGHAETQHDDYAAGAKWRVQ